MPVRSLAAVLIALCSTATLVGAATAAALRGEDSAAPLGSDGLIESGGERHGSSPQQQPGRRQRTRPAQEGRLAERAFSGDHCRESRLVNGGNISDDDEGERALWRPSAMRQGGRVRRILSRADSGGGADVRDAGGRATGRSGPGGCVFTWESGEFNVHHPILPLSQT